MNINYLSVAASQGPPAGSSLLNNIIEYWRMDEASGNLIGEINSNELTVTGAIQNVDGKITKAIELDTNTDSATMSYNASLSYGTTDSITISFWVYFDILPQTAGYIYYGCRFTNTVSPSTALRIWFPNDGAYIAFGITDSSSTAYTVESSYGYITAGSWYHILCYKNSTTSKIYINGVDRTSTTYSTPNNIRDFNGILNIGNYSIGSSNGLDGKICEFAYWNRQLTTDEIAELYNSGNGKTYPFTS